MKTYKISSYICILVLSVLLFTNCSDSDDNKKVVNITVNKDQLIAGTGAKKVIRIKDNETLQLKTHIMPTDAANKELSFRMKGASVASVSPIGLLTPISIGVDALIIESMDGSGAFIEYGVDVIDHKVKITSIVLPSTAQKAMIGKGETFELASKLEIKPADAWDKSMTYTSSDESILTVDANGVVTGVDYGIATVTIKAQDGSEKEATSEISVSRIISKYYEVADMADWTVKVSHALPLEGGKNKAGSIIDGDLTDKVSFLSMMKPGGSMEGITVGEDEEVYCIIDMKESREVDFFRYHHRNTNGGLRFYAVTVSGSSDGVTFTKIVENLALPNAQSSAADSKDTGEIEIPKTNYRYYKISFTDYKKDSLPGQLTEIQFGYKYVTTE